MRVSRVSFILLQSELSSSGIFSFHFSIGQCLGLDRLHLIGCGVRKSSCRLRKYASILCIPCISCEKSFADVEEKMTRMNLQRSQESSESIPTRQEHVAMEDYRAYHPS